MRIGDAAATTGLTPRALRFYEEEGLLHPRRAPSGHRRYAEADLRRLRVIRELLDAGLTVADVRSFAHVLDGDLVQRSAPAPAPGASYRSALEVSPESEPKAVRETVCQGECCAVGQVSVRRLAELDARIERLTTLRERLASRIATRFDTVFQG